MNIKSPVTGNDVKLKSTIQAEDIKVLYLRNHQIDINSYFKDITEVSIYECLDTSYQFYYPFDIFGDSKFYDHLNQQYKDYYVTWKWENEIALGELNITDNILDVGCGDGSFLNELAAKNFKNLVGIDTSNNQIQNPNVTILNVSIEELSADYHNSFDVICCFQILEHISDVKSFLNTVLTFLKKGGKLIIAVPNNNPHIYKYDKMNTLNLPPHHAGLWNVNSLKHISKPFNLSLKTFKNQPIDAQINYYICLKKEYLIKKCSWYNLIFKVSFFNKLYDKIHYLFKNKINGHSILGVYIKN